VKTLIKLIGAVQKDGELRYTREGLAILNFVVAGTQGKKPWFHRISVIGKFAEAIAERIKAGAIVSVQGELVQDRWEKDGKTYSAVQIRADGVRVLSNKGHEIVQDNGGFRLIGGMNVVFGYGNLTKAPVRRTTSNGTPVANATVAVNRVFTSGGEKQEQVSYFDLTAWEALAEELANLPKGTGIDFTGVLENDSYETSGGEKRFTTRINVKRLFRAEPKLADQGEKPAAGEPVAVGAEDDLPF